jgi:hypothetical protein
MSNNGNAPKGFIIILLGSMIDDNYRESNKFKREWSHMWDERRLIKNPLG